jgi:hypothetical protein
MLLLLHCPLDSPIYSILSLLIWSPYLLSFSLCLRFYVGESLRTLFLSRLFFGSAITNDFVLRHRLTHWLNDLLFLNIFCFKLKKIIFLSFYILILKLIFKKYYFNIFIIKNNLKNNINHFLKHFLKQVWKP